MLYIGVACNTFSANFQNVIYSKRGNVIFFCLFVDWKHKTDFISASSSPLLEQKCYFDIIALLRCDESGVQEQIDLCSLKLIEGNLVAFCIWLDNKKIYHCRILYRIDRYLYAIHNEDNDFKLVSISSICFIFCNEDSTFLL